MLKRVLYRSGRTVVSAYAQLMLDLDVVYHAPLPAGPKIIAANHPTTTDPFLITILEPDHMSILVSDTLFRVPMFGHYLEFAGHIRVASSNGRVAFEQARHLLEIGRTVGIFPEGALSPVEGGLARPRTGAARLTLATGAPVIPVGIHLRRERCWITKTRVENGVEIGRHYLRGPYAITIGRAMHFAGDVEDRECVRAVAEGVMQSIFYLAQESARRIDKPQAKAGGRMQWLRTVGKWLGAAI